MHVIVEMGQMQVCNLGSDSTQDYTSEHACLSAGAMTELIFLYIPH